MYGTISGILAASALTTIPMCEKWKIELIGVRYIYGKRIISWVHPHAL